MGTRFAFLGVTASRSSINAVFPAWADELGLDDAVLEPVDLPLDTPLSRYREVVRQIRDDPDHRGGLVTTHKVRLLEAAADLFDELDPDARLAGEVSCISKRNGWLYGHAKDPATAGRSLEDFVPTGHFGDGAEVLCLGAGGSGLAISIYLAARRDPTDRPQRVTLVSRTARRIDACRAAHAQLDVDGPSPSIDYVLNEDARANDELVGSLPPGSLVINATGMGKDRPGSPITDLARFPLGGFAWELNYRGELDFLHQARAQTAGRDLVVEDGWRYFVHGWSEVVAECFGLDLDPAMVERLGSLAAAVRA